MSETNKAPHKGSIQSVDRAVAILKCFEDTITLSLAEISRLTGLHKSTTFGLVSTLEANGMLEQDQVTGRYRLGLSLFRLGNRVDTDIKQIAAPYLDRLAELSGETINFAVRDGDCVVYIDKRESTHTLRIAPDYGRRRAMYNVATGKAILAMLPQETITAILQRTDFRPLTPNTPMSPEAIMNQLRDVRLLGYATNRQELEIDRVGIAAPVCDFTGRPVAAVSVCGPISRMTEEFCRRNAAWVVECARSISENL